MLDQIGKDLVNLALLYLPDVLAYRPQLHNIVDIITNSDLLL